MVVSTLLVAALALVQSTTLRKEDDPICDQLPNTKLDRGDTHMKACKKTCEASSDQETCKKLITWQVNTKPDWPMTSREINPCYDKGDGNPCKPMVFSAIYRVEKNRLQDDVKAVADYFKMNVNMGVKYKHKTLVGDPRTALEVIRDLYKEYENYGNACTTYGGTCLYPLRVMYTAWQAYHDKEKCDWTVYHDFIWPHDAALFDHPFKHPFMKRKQDDKCALQGAEKWEEAEKGENIKKVIGCLKAGQPRYKWEEESILTGCRQQG